MAPSMVGKVVNAHAKGLLVSARAMLPIGTPLVDARSQPVGKVTDVIGPVAAPYLVVSLAKGQVAQRLLQRDVYKP